MKVWVIKQKGQTDITDFIEDEVVGVLDHINRVLFEGEGTLKRAVQEGKDGYELVHDYETIVTAFPE